MVPGLAYEYFSEHELRYRREVGLDPVYPSVGRPRWPRRQRGQEHDAGPQLAPRGWARFRARLRRAHAESPVPVALP